MSRIGRLPITIPAGVEVDIEGQDVTVKGPKGTLSHSIAPPIEITRDEDGVLTVTRPNDERQSRALHGLSRTLVANMVDGRHPGLLQDPGDRRRRLPRRRQGLGPRVRARLQPPGRRRPHLRASASTSSPRRGSASRASTSSRSARSPPTSASSASPTPTRARACVTPARSSAARSERLVSSHGCRCEAERYQDRSRACSRASVATSACARRSPVRRPVRASS